MEVDPKRRWTLEAARAMLDEVRSRTDSAVGEVDPLLEEREKWVDGSDERREVDVKIQKAISVMAELVVRTAPVMLRAFRPRNATGLTTRLALSAIEEGT